MHRSRLCHFVVDVPDLDQGIAFWSAALNAAEEPLPESSRRTCRQLALSLVSARRAAQVAEELRDGESREEGLAQEDRVLAQITGLAISPPEGPRYRPVIEGKASRR